MKKQLLIASVLVTAASPVLGAPWVRGFVVDNYEPAFYYGGRGGTEEPGSDCRKGTIPILDYKTVLKTGWRTDAEVEKLTMPVSTGGEGEKVISPAMQHRGFRRDIDSYINPFTAPDAGMQQVTGGIAEGFDLDGNANSGGFTSPSGARGVDNAFTAPGAATCPIGASLITPISSQRANDQMLDGLYTMVIRVSGNADPMNDDHAVFEVAYSPDHVVKDANGNLVRDVSFRIVKSEQYTRLAKARIRNGVLLETEQADVHLPAFSWGETNRGDVLFQKGRVRLTLNKDGDLSGLVGGYRDWREVYARDTFNVPSGGATQRDLLSREPDLDVLRAEAQCRWHARPQDRPKHRHFRGLSLHRQARLCGGSTGTADGGPTALSRRRQGHDRGGAVFHGHQHRHGRAGGSPDESGSANRQHRAG